MHARWTWLAGAVRERETHARSDNSFSENDTSITRRGAAITISPSANPPKGDMDIVNPKGIPPMRADSWNRYTVRRFEWVNCSAWRFLETWAARVPLRPTSPTFA